MSVLFAILLFSFLIFIHELGHFVAAKLSGVQVNEFALFMGPAIFKKQIGETLYTIRTIPIGGYCAMEGEDEDTDNPRSFQKAAWWKRLIILVAGAAMNFVMGVVLMFIVYMPAQAVVEPVIASFEEFSTVDGPSGLQVGDRILELDGEKIAYQKPGWGHHGMVKHVGKASSICMKKDESGNILYSMVLDIPNVFRGTHVNIVLNQETNRCKVYYRRKYARETNGYDTGIVYPLGTTTVLKGQEPLLR
mgnify:CR=1 FL=1